MNIKNHHKILEAMRFSELKHRGQTRKGSGHDYILHPMMCTYFVAKFKESEELVALICALWLHDTVEDTDATYQEIFDKFGPMVMSIVHELENDEKQIKLIGKLAYHKKKVLGISNYGLLGKLVDRLHNILDLPTQKYVLDTIELIDHLGTHRKLTGSQQEVAQEILKACNEFQQNNK